VKYRSSYFGIFVFWEYWEVVETENGTLLFDMCSFAAQAFPLMGKELK